MRFQVRLLSHRQYCIVKEDVPGCSLGHSNYAQCTTVSSVGPWISRSTSVNFWCEKSFLALKRIQAPVLTPLEACIPERLALFADTMVPLI